MKRHGRDTEEFFYLCVRRRGCPEPGAGENEIADDDEIPLTLVYVEGGDGGLESGVGKPSQKRVRLPRAFRVREPRPESSTAYDQAPVGCEDHVRLPRYRLNHVNLVP